MVRIPEFIGVTQISWSTFELSLEMYIQRLLGISDRNAHTLFAKINMGVKQEIAKSLAKDSGLSSSEEVIKAIDQVQNIAKRNHIIHSVLFVNQDWTTGSFAKRDLGRGLNAKLLDVTVAQARDFVHQLADAAKEFQDLAEITDDDIQAYVDFLREL